jgi:hypothetical protein
LVRSLVGFDYYSRPHREDAPGAARVAAANAVLDRGHGKPRQALEHGGDGGAAIQIVYLNAEDARA